MDEVTNSNCEVHYKYCYRYSRLCNIGWHFMGHSLHRFPYSIANYDCSVCGNAVNLRFKWVLGHFVLLPYLVIKYAKIRDATQKRDDRHYNVVFRP